MTRRGSTRWSAISSAGASGLDARPLRAAAAVSGVAGRGRVRDRADPLLRRREMVGIWLLGHLHRDGRFALSGVVMALCARCVRAPRRALLAALPAALVVTAALGYHFTTTNPFNPLQLQNPATWRAAALEHRRLLCGLLPFFFLAGAVRQPDFRAERRPHRPGLWLRPDRRGRRRGAGAGGDVRGARVLPGAAACWSRWPRRLLRRGPRRWRCAGGRCRAGSAPRRCCCSTTRRSSTTSRRSTRRCTRRMRASWPRVLSPRGDYVLLDDFTERVDTDISNNAGMLGVPGPAADLRPVSRRQPHRRAAEAGRAGRRLCAGRAGRAAVSADPAREGAAGGRIGRLPHRRGPGAGCGACPVLEPEPVLLRALEHGLGPSPALADRCRACSVG